MSPPNPVRSGPLNHAQEVEWWKLRRGESVNASFSVFPPAAMDRRELIGALNTEVDRHESLRTSFAYSADGHPVQVVRRFADLPISACSSTDAVASEDFKRALIATPFRPDDHRLARIGVIEADGLVTEVVFVICHALIDGRGTQVLRARLEIACTGSEPPPLTAPQPIDSAASERSSLAPMAEAAARFWRAELERIPSSLFPADSGGVLDRYGSHHLSERAVPLLYLTARKLATTPAIVYMAAVYALTAAMTAGGTTVIRSHFRGRTLEEMDSVGCYHRILPVAVDTSDKPALTVLIKRLKAKLAEVGTHQRVGGLGLLNAMSEVEAARGSRFADGVTVNFDYGDEPGARRIHDDEHHRAALADARERKLLIESYEPEADPNGLAAYLLTRLRGDVLEVFGTFNARMLSLEQMHVLLAGPERLLTELSAGRDPDQAWITDHFGSRIRRSTCSNQLGS